MRASKIFWISFCLFSIVFHCCYFAAADDVARRTAHGVAVLVFLFALGLWLTPERRSDR